LCARIARADRALTQIAASGILPVMPSLPPFTTLISVDDLAALRATAPATELRIVDCRFDLADPGLGARQYAEAHVPGAVYADLDRDLADQRGGGITGGRHPLPTREATRARFAAMGIGDAAQVVGYDAVGGFYAARLWWMLRWIGHAAVAVLDGGWQAWTAAGRPVDAIQAAPAPAALTLRPALTRLATVADVEAASAAGTTPIIDARAPDRFDGSNETIDRVGGHIPGARNRFFRGNLGADGRFKPIDALRAELIAAGVDGDVIHQCGSGVTACHNLLAARHAGLGEGRLYAGSWSEWITDPSRPIAR
jgi:thiosulfate/3-mercaptopyruvate sulfurtransferase